MERQKMVSWRQQTMEVEIVSIKYYREWEVDVGQNPGMDFG